MPVPPAYERASTHFSEFLLQARDLAFLQTTHQSYTMVQGVFQAFRRRISVEQALAFADLLPPLLRALFVTDWDIHEVRRPFVSREEMTREVQALRANHNVSPDDSIECVARALRKYVNSEHFDALLATFPPGAAEFWRA